MKKFIISLFSIFTFALVNAQEVKNLVYDANAEVRKVGDFTGIDVSGAITLY
jgi:hypothetical protein